MGHNLKICQTCENKRSCDACAELASWIADKSANWISVKDKLPEVNENVMIYSRGGGVAEGARKPCGWVQFRWSAQLTDADVTHWMPLTPAP